MRLGSILLWGTDLAQFEEMAAQSDTHPFSVIGIGDSPSTWHDYVVSMAVVANSTEHALLGPMVTSPLGRHPVTMASELSALQHLSGGRVVLSIGTGGSAASALGRHAAPSDEMRDYVRALRDLFNGEWTMWRGEKIPRLVHAHPVPIYIAANGPKGLRLAGEIGDGIVLCAGSALEYVDLQLGHAAEGAAAAGRSIDDLVLWAYTRLSIRQDPQEAIADVSANFVASGAFQLRPARQMATVPEELREPLKEYQRRYDTTAHAVEDGPNVRMAEELGLLPYLAGRFAIAGPPDFVRERVTALEQRGISCLMLALPGQRDQVGTLARVTEAFA